MKDFILAKCFVSAKRNNFNERMKHVLHIQVKLNK